MQIPWRVLGYLGSIGMLLWGGYAPPVLGQQTEPRMVTADAYARIRVGPSVAQPTLKQFFEPTPVEALAYDGLYWMVLVDGQVGYVIDAGVTATPSVRAFFEANEIPLGTGPDGVPTVATLEGNPEPPPFNTPDANPPAPEATLPDAGEPDSDPASQASTPPSTATGPPATILGQRTVVFRAGFGTALPLAPPKFPDLWQRGISVHGSTGYSLNGHTEFGIEFSYNTHPLERDQVFAVTGLIDEAAEVVAGDVTVTTVMGYLKLNIISVAETVAPYFLFGGGAFRFTPAAVRIAGDDDPVQDTEDTDFLFRKSENVGGFMLGGGVDLRITDTVHLFLEARGLFGLTEREGTFLTPFRAGIMFRP